MAEGADTLRMKYAINTLEVTVKTLTDQLAVSAARSNIAAREFTLAGQRLADAQAGLRLLKAAQDAADEDYATGTIGG